MNWLATPISSCIVSKVNKKPPQCAAGEGAHIVQNVCLWGARLPFEKQKSVPSLALPIGGAFFCKGLHPFFLIFTRKQKVKSPTLIGKPIL